MEHLQAQATPVNVLSERVAGESRRVDVICAGSRIEVRETTSGPVTAFIFGVPRHARKVMLTQKDLGRLAGTQGASADAPEVLREFFTSGNAVLSDLGERLGVRAEPCEAGL